MTSEKKNARTASRTVTQSHTETSTRDEQLTWSEEMTVRMAKGLSEGPEHALQFRGQLHGELQARLAAMEAELLQVMFQRGPQAVQEATQAPAIDEEGRARILEQLARVHNESSDS